MRRLLGNLPVLMVAVNVALLSTGRLPSLAGRPLSLAAAAAMGLVLYALKRRGAASPIHVGYLLYMAVNAAGAWCLPVGATRFLSGDAPAVLFGSLCAAAAVPALVAGVCFTKYFARKTVPPAVWATPLFKRINRHMTWGWVALFAASAALTLVPHLFPPGRNTAVRLIFQMVLPPLLLLGVGVPFTRRYPRYYQRKMGIPSPAAFGAAGGPAGGRPMQGGRKEREKEVLMSKRLKVVAVNGSPQMAIGNTSQMIAMMKPVLEAEGIGLEEILLAEKRIEFCAGCGVCLEKGRCWRGDDHQEIAAALLGADGIILASPVYFGHVTAQMKVFIDRSLAYGHRRRATWKPGMAVSVSAGTSETTTALYLAGVLGVYGAFSVGTLTALAVAPGAFMGKELVEARARDLALDLARALKEGRRYPATEHDLSFYLFMRDLVGREKAFMRDDYDHWQASGFLGGFEAYIGQSFSRPAYDQEMRKTWIREMVGKEKAGRAEPPATGPAEPKTTGTLEALLRTMPARFKGDEAGGLECVYQFEITGAENFTGHARIGDGKCAYFDGPHPKPDVTVRSPADVWLAVVRGETGGRGAFLAGKFKVEGDLGLLLRLKDLFSVG
jgi:multimeric flavodoxin WrbA/putative sterol carrier protein